MPKTTIYDKLRAAGCLTALLMAGLSGCESGPLATQNWNNPFAPTDTSYKEAYGVTPAQVSRQIRNLGEGAAEMTASEQQSACVELINRYAKESDPLIRREMVYALGLFPDVYSLPGLRAAIKDADPFVRVEACHAWSRRSSAEALEVLAGIAQADTDDNADVRQAAIKGLRRFPSPKSVRVLGSLLDDRDPALQYLAIQSLKSAAGQDFGDDVRKWNSYIASNYGGESPAPAPGVVDRNGSMVAETPSTDSWH